MLKKRSKLHIVFYFFLLLPLWMWLTWMLWPNQTIAIAIVDKTLNANAGKHASLNWVLHQQKISKTSSRLYDPSRDYFGFFQNKNKYELKGLERFSDAQLDKLSSASDAAYFTDTYGIYSNADHTTKSGELSKGMSDQDLYFLKKMKQNKKLIITEFNTFATPTSEKNAQEFERLFKIRWTGWIGKYFTSLSTVENKNLPSWIVQQYKKQNGNKWPFSNSGIVFINRNKEIVVLENKTHLLNDAPVLVTSKLQREKYDLPKEIRYPFWFDVIQTSQANNLISFYDLRLNDEGRKLLKRNHIPAQFPAIVGHLGKDYKFFYFAGDFADNPVSQTAASFKGIGLFRKYFFDQASSSDEINFFWNYYRPMLSEIFSDYKNELKQ